MARRIAALAAVAVGVLAASAFAQVSRLSGRPLSAHAVVPQSRVFSAAGAPTVNITAVDVGVVIVEQTATTTMDVSLSNPGGSRLEAELIVPVPEGAVVRSFTFQGAAAEPIAELLPKDEARKTYEAIVRKMRDPALLEFLGCNLIRSSVFPVETHGTQKLRLTYEHILRAEGDRVDYVLPRTESVDYIVPWSVSVKIRSTRPIATVYSPSHRIDTIRPARQSASVRVAADAVREPGSFRLSWLYEAGGVSGTLMAYPDANVGGGYFLMLAGLPVEMPKKGDEAAIKREVTLVIDRSGSMNGEKLDQAREAALQVLAGLDDGESFNLILYNEGIDRFSEAPVVKAAKSVADARAWLKRVQASGGTNIHDALVEALRQKPSPGMLPVVLFLTDGQPTVGQTAESAIRRLAVEGNPHKRRIFTFGVGLKVNTPLLDALAADSRGSATYVLPQEDVEVKVAGVFKRLSGPVLSDVALRVQRPDGTAVAGDVSDVLPSRLPDLFEGDQLVLLGKYADVAPELAFVVSGNYLGRQRSFRFRFTFDRATTRNAFVPRLWASRRVGVLVDAIRRLGADVPNAADLARTDPRFKELVDEVVKLATEFGILTEDTAFLAREGTDLSRRDRVLEEAMRNFNGRAVQTRTGMASYNQSVNGAFQQAQTSMNHRNGYFDEQMNRVEISNVQQVNDRAFYQRGNRWVDSRVLGREREVKPDRVVDVGSDEFMALAERLAREGRAGSVSLRGEILMTVDGQTVLIK